MEAHQSRSPAQTYAIGVCYTAIVLFAVSAGMTAFSVIRWNFPQITGGKIVEARQLANESPVATCLLGEPCTGLSPEDVRRERAHSQRRVQNEEAAERFRGRRAAIIWALLSVASAVLWLGHWRLLSSAGPTARRGTDA